MLNKHLEYLKDNPKGYWFRAKLYGWGWTPVKWQGWLVVVIFVGLIVLNAFRIDSTPHSDVDMLYTFLPQTAILTLILILICWKTGEKPRWQWGPPSDKDKKE